MLSNEIKENVVSHLPKLNIGRNILIVVAKYIEKVEETDKVRISGQVKIIPTIVVVCCLKGMDELGEVSK